MHPLKEYTIAFSYRTDGNFTNPTTSLTDLANFGSQRDESAFVEHRTASGAGSSPSYTFDPPVIPANTGNAKLYKGTLIMGAQREGASALTFVSQSASYMEVTGLTIRTSDGGAIFGDPETAWQGLESITRDDNGGRRLQLFTTTPAPTPIRRTTTGSDVFSESDLSHAYDQMKGMFAAEDEKTNDEQTQAALYGGVAVVAGEEGNGQEYSSSAATSGPPTDRVHG